MQQELKCELEIIELDKIFGGEKNEAVFVYESVISFKRKMSNFNLLSMF